jgi:hypothetical protein
VRASYTSASYCTVAPENSPLVGMLIDQSLIANDIGQELQNRFGDDQSLVGLCKAERAVGTDSERDQFRSIQHR